MLTEDEPMTIAVRDFVDSCSTRYRGREAYDQFERRLAGASFSAIKLSFVGVEFVSPSFLDETVVRLVEEHPELRGRLAVEGLSDRASTGLRKILEQRRVREGVDLA